MGLYFLMDREQNKPLFMRNTNVLLTVSGNALWITAVSTSVCVDMIKAKC